MNNLVNIEDVCNEIKYMDNNGLITRSVNHVCEDLRAIPTVPAIPIPDGATNGDMFVAVFKPYKVIVWSGQVQVYLTEQKWQMFGLSWWFAQYKKEGDGNAKGNN